MKVFKEIIAYFSHMNNKRRTLVWYIISLSIVLIEYLINSRLDKFVYFHPFISIVINIVLLIDLFFIPITFIAIDILKAQKNSIIRNWYRTVIFYGYFCLLFL